MGYSVVGLIFALLAIYAFGVQEDWFWFVGFVCATIYCIAMQIKNDDQ